MNVMIDKDEWMEVWNSTAKLQHQVKAIESRLQVLETFVREVKNLS